MSIGAIVVSLAAGYTLLVIVVLGTNRDNWYPRPNRNIVLPEHYGERAKINKKL